MNERLQTLIGAARHRHMAGARANGIVVLLLGALVWYTKWPSLRAGLTILLIGYFGVLVFQIRRSGALARNINEPTTDWFDGEERFVGRLNLLEAIIRTIGFLVLGYGFWTATGSIGIALALGIGYPVVAYFGMERRKYLRTRQLLKTEREAAFHSADF